jgi:protein SCO1/2
MTRIATLFLAILLCGCAGSKPEVATKEYQMRGVVMSVDAAGHTATIKHEAIKGFMGAMTMGYPVKDAAELSKLSAGEPITATVYAKGDDFWVGNFKKQ